MYTSLGMSKKKKRISGYEGNQTLQVELQFHLINQTSTSVKVHLIHPCYSSSILIWLVTLKINPTQQNQEINDWPSKINATISTENKPIPPTAKLPQVRGKNVENSHCPSQFLLKKMKFKNFLEQHLLQRPHPGFSLHQAPALPSPVQAFRGRDGRKIFEICFERITMENYHLKTTKD